MKSVVFLLLAAGAEPPPEGHFIVDQTGQVSAQARADVDELALTVHAGGFGELMVLVVDSTRGEPPLRFGTKVFSSWPVGHAENVDAAMLLACVKDRTAAVVLGDGFVGVSTKDLEAVVVARLREGKLDDAVREGARAALRLLEAHHRGVILPVADAGIRDAGRSR